MPRMPRPARESETRPATQRLNLRGVAEVIGVSPMTVSRALRGAGGVSEKRRKEIVAAARRLGYRPDPTLSALNAYRHGLRRPEGQEQIVFLTSGATEEGWRDLAYIRCYIEGAGERARELGYSLTPFWLGSEGMSARRAASILKTRGVRGLLVAPIQELGDRWAREFAWRDFAAVALGPSLRRPLLDHTAADFGRIIRLAADRLVSAGYRRVALAFCARVDERFGHAISDTFRGEQRRRPELGDLEPNLWPATAPEAFDAWYRELRPDAILTQRPGDMLALAERMKREEGVAPPVYHFSLYSTDDPGLPGVMEDLSDAARHAVDLLHAKLLANRLGLPAHPVELRFGGEWRWAGSRPAGRAGRARSRR